MSVTDDDLVRACDCAAVAEVAYTDGDGHVRVTAVTPLVLAGAPALALHYGRSALARDLARSGDVALAVSDSRMAYRGWQPVGASGAVRVEEDREGTRFQDHLLDQELRKHPPSRALLDTPVLRREHWWYLPRWVIRLVPTRIRTLGRRAGPQDGVLAFGAGGSVDVDTVAVEDWTSDRVAVRSLAGHDVGRVRAPGAVFTHDFSVPDLERWVEHTVAGELHDGQLDVTVRTGTPVLPKPLSLRGRLGRLRALERTCRRGLGTGS